MEIKLRTTLNARSQDQTRMIMEKFIEACCKLDASIFEPFIEEDQMFEDLDKYRFLQLMKDRIDSCVRVGIKQLTAKRSVCMGCQRGHTTYEFYDGDQIRFAYVFLFDDAQLTDIFKCNHSEGAFDPLNYPF